MSGIQIAVARYISDPVRNEPRNIGVIGWSDGKAAGRFWGEDEGGNLDLRRVRSFIEDRSTYRDWVDFWRSTIAAQPIDDVEHPEPVTVKDGTYLSALANVTTGNFELMLGGEVLTPKGKSVEDAVDEVFARLVGADVPTVNAVGERSELDERGHTHRQLAREAYYALKRSNLKEQEDFVQRHQVYGETRNGASVPAVFDFAVIPREGDLFSKQNGAVLLVDAVSFVATADDETEVIDRARAVASKTVEVRAVEEQMKIRVLVSNGRSADTDVASYAMSILRDEAELVLISVPEFVELVPTVR